VRCFNGCQWLPHGPLDAETLQRSNENGNFDVDDMICSDYKGIFAELLSSLFCTNHGILWPRHAQTNARKRLAD